MHYTHDFEHVHKLVGVIRMGVIRMVVAQTRAVRTLVVPASIT